MGTAKQAARTAKDSTAFRRIARAGFVVLGIVHIVLGSIAISVATGGGGDADQDGAMEKIRETPIGGLVLASIAAGLLALAVWQIVSALLIVAPGEAKKWGQRAKAVGIAVAYLAVAVLAVVFAVGGHVESESTSRTLSARVLAAPGGVALLVVVGLAVVAVGGGFVVGAFSRAFEKTMDLPTGDGRAGIGRAGIVVLGSVGYFAKGVAIAVTGLLFVVAAVTQDPEKAAGLDAGLHSLLSLPWGGVALWAVAVGLIVYGVFCIARSRYARM